MIQSSCDGRGVVECSGVDNFNSVSCKKVVWISCKDG